MSDSHFKDKDPVQHVVEKQAQGIVDGVEIHGREIPGHIFAAFDAAKDSALLIGLASLLLSFFIKDPKNQILFLAVFSLSLILWKTIRSALFGWSRLERLHRVIAQEKWEIDHHRAQERYELKALYAAKGFKEPLLDDVIEVLMADGDRLLKVMVEEELGLTLEKQEHPLKQALGAFLGSALAVLFTLLGYLADLNFGVAFFSLLMIAISSGATAFFEKNDFLQAVVWNLGAACLVMGGAFYLSQFVLA